MFCRNVDLANEINPLAVLVSVILKKKDLIGGPFWTFEFQDDGHRWGTETPSINVSISDWKIELL